MSFRPNWFGDGLPPFGDHTRRGGSEEPEDELASMLRKVSEMAESLEFARRMLARVLLSTEELSDEDLARCYRIIAGDYSAEHHDFD